MAVQEFAISPPKRVAALPGQCARHKVLDPRQLTRLVAVDQLDPG